MIVLGALSGTFIFKQNLYEKKITNDFFLKLVFYKELKSKK